MDNDFFEAAEVLTSSFESEERSITPPLDDSSDEEARVAPSTPEVPEELSRIFNRYHSIGTEKTPNHGQTRNIASK